MSVLRKTVKQPDRPLEGSHEDVMSLRFERSDQVLWSLAPGGIILHQVDHGLYLELDELGYHVWGYLDGVRNGTQIAGHCAADDPGKVLDIIAVLAANRYVELRRNG